MSTVLIRTREQKANLGIDCEWDGNVDMHNHKYLNAIAQQSALMNFYLFYANLNSAFNAKYSLEKC